MAQRSPRRVTATAAGKAKGREIVGRPERRQAWIMGSFLLLLFIFGGRLVQVQAFEGSDMAEDALSDRMSSSVLHAVRGDIVDANGVELATSVERYDIVVDQTLVEDFKKTDGSRVVAEGPAGAAELLAPLLDLDEDKLAADLAGEKRWVRIASGVTGEVWDQIRDLRISGIDAERAEERIYPSDNVAGNIVGFVGSDGTPLAGLERLQDERLTGKDGERVFERDANQVPIPGGVERVNPAEPGETLHLTVDRDLQYQVQEITDDEVERTGAEYGIAIVQDVETGDLLALADSNTVDPNNPGESDSEARGSRAVEDVLEPGSTSKVITIAGLIEEGIFDPESEFSVGDRYTMPNGEEFRDSIDHAKQKLTLTGILSESSNVGTIMAGEKLTTDQAYDYIRKFGFGEPTGVGLPSESGGILRPPDQWDGRTRYAVLFGQGLAITALQGNQVFATLANDGKRVPPRIIKGWSDAEGEYHELEPEEPVDVVSEDTADTLVKMLESVVEDGTGKDGAVPGYRVGGKTGTAQAANGAGEYDGITASFIGVAPADDPKLAVSMILHRPKSGEWAGDIAGPGFSQVMGTSLQHLGVAPHDGSDVDLFPSTYE